MQFAYDVWRTEREVDISGIEALIPAITKAL
jgi:hypothetical protein